MNIVVLLFFISRFFTVVQQPIGNPMFVSQSGMNIITQWQAVDNAFLAHDWLAGSYFGDLKIGDIVTTFGRNLEVNNFIVTEIITIPANFDNDGTFLKVYTGGKLVLQTCRGDGRLFVIAERVP